MSATPVGTRPRLDLHNASIDIAAATAGQCGFTHLPSGGICRMPHRHLGPCQLKHPTDQPTRVTRWPEVRPLADTGRTGAPKDPTTRRRGRT
jgi:hypothetical protein